MTSPGEPTGTAVDVPAPSRPVGGAMIYRTIVEAVLSAAVLPVSVALAFIVAAHFGTVAALVVALPPALWFVLRVVRSKRRVDARAETPTPWRFFSTPRDLSGPRRASWSPTRGSSPTWR